MTWTNTHIQKGLNNKHLELMELMIHEPELSHKDMCDKLGVTEAWGSTIKHSDLFQEEFRRRLAEHRSHVSERIVRKIEVVTEVTLDRMSAILKSDEEVGIGRLAQVFDITAKRLFPDERSGGTVVNIALADPDAIRKARERADRLRSPVIDVTAEPEPVSS